MDENVSRDLLDAWKHRHQIETDYQAAKALGVRRQLVSMWRLGERQMTDNQALVISEDLGLEWSGVVARLRTEKNAGTDMEDRWRRYCARVRVASIAALAVGVTLSTSHTPASAQDQLLSNANDVTPYTLCAVVSRLLSRCVKWFAGGFARRWHHPGHAFAQRPSNFAW